MERERGTSTPGTPKSLRGRPVRVRRRPPRAVKTDGASAETPWSDRFALRTQGMTSSVIRELLKMTADPEIISFGGGLPAPEVFPLAEIEAAAGRVIQEHGRAALQYGPTEGFLPLREMLVRHMARYGIQVTPANVLITSGAQQALDLIGKLFLNAGDRVLTEQPTYLGALQAFTSYQARYLTVPIDDEGMRVDLLEEALRAGSVGEVADSHHLSTAVQLYRGELLAGFFVKECPEFEDWLVTEQTRLRESAVDGLRKLIDNYRRRGEYRFGVHYARRLVAIEPLSEEAHRELMRLFALSGQRNRALAHYEERSGFPVRHLHYYQVFAGFRFGGIMIRLAQQMGKYGVMDADASRAFELDNTVTRLLASLLDLPAPGQPGARSA